MVVVSENQISWSQGFGNQEEENMHYQIGSIEKVITAISILQMHEQDKLDIYDDINNYLSFSVRHPGFPDIPVTIEMLLAHRSGLEMFQNQFKWDTSYLNNYTSSTSSIIDLSAEDFIKASLDPEGINFNPDKWKFKPGTNYQYSPSGYFMLNYLIEKVSGQTYSQYVTENIFKLLGMNNSVFSDLEPDFNYPDSYTRIGSQNKNKLLPPREGMYTTTEDMAALMIAYMNGGKFGDKIILQEKTLELMLQKHSPGKDLFHLSSNCLYDGYGFGIIQYGNNLFGHGGSTIGYQSLWTFNKKDKSGYIIFTNANGLLYGKSNFDSVWSTVSSVEDLIKSELGYPRNNIRYILVGVIIIGVIINILYFSRKIYIKKKNRK